MLCDFVRDAEFDWMGVFSYSDEDTSESYHLDGKVDAETIAERRDTLMAIQQKITRRQMRALDRKTGASDAGRARRRIRI